MLPDAVELDGLPDKNPAAIGKRLRLTPPPRARAEAIKVMTRQQLTVFLEACRNHVDGSVRRLYPFFLLMARTGLRLGEALAVQWEDINWRDRGLRVERAFSGSGEHRRLERKCSV
jgi:integrase